METAEIIRRLDAIQNEFLAFTPTLDGSYRETSTPADVRIARAVCWIEGLKRDLRGDPAGAAQAFPSDPATDSG
jgi:hypothetical protein